VNDEGAAIARVCLDQLIFDANAATKVEGPRLARREHVGRALNEPAVAAIRLQDAADPAAGLEERDLRCRVELDQAMRGGEAGDAAADDGDAARRM
jgi:hypothetical protein